MTKKIFYIFLVFVLSYSMHVSLAFAADVNQAGNINTIYSSGRMYSGGCGHSASEGCDDETYVFDAEEQEQFYTDQYVREDVEVKNLYHTYTAPPAYPEDGGDQGTWEVYGTGICDSASSWEGEFIGNLCWGSFTLHSVANCEPRRNTSNFLAVSPKMVASANNTCHAGLCVIDYQPPASPHFIKGDTGDNMAAILPYTSTIVTKGFIVNNFCGGEPHWIERKSSPRGDLYLMVPSWCQDYNTFVDAYAEAAPSEESCYPATLSMCPASKPTRPAMPPHPSCGGHAHGSSWCGAPGTDDDGNPTCDSDCTCDCGRTRCN